MTRWLLNRFAPHINPDQPMTQRDSARLGTLGSGVGLCINLFLAALKGVFGLLSGSVAVTADAINNLSDSASSVVTLIALRISKKPTDEEHPFGHGRMEYLAALVVACLILVMGFQFLVSAIQRIQSPEAVSMEPLFLIILAASILIKGWLGLFYRKLGQLSDSTAMRASAVDSWSDMLTTGLVVISILLERALGWQVDGWAGLIVSIIILYAGVGVARETISKLLGEGIDPALARSIKQALLAYDGILGVHDLIVHNYGPHHYMASIHAEVPNDVSIETSHAIIDRAEREIAASLGILLSIHMDPIDAQDERLNTLRDEVIALLSKIDPELGMHDLRLLDTPEGTSLIFDVELPVRYKDKQIPALKRKIQEQAKAIAPDCRLIMTLDRNYEKTNGGRS